jgi:hypothetical protein
MVRWGWRQLALGVGGMGVAAVVFCGSRGSSLSRAVAQSAEPAKMANPIPTTGSSSSDYATRPVANIFHGISITREDFGEYLIARDADRLQNFVNKRIIEEACKREGIDVTAQEIDVSLAEDLNKMKVDIKDFVEKVLKRYNKSLYEWREDVIRPKLLMTKLVRKRGVEPRAEDLQKAFESFYGEKLRCQVIMWPKSEETKVKNDIYAKIRDSEAEFERAAKIQASPSLAACGGVLDYPISHHSTGNEEMERTLFNLQVGELSRIIEMPDNTIAVFKCIARIPADSSKKLEDVRDELNREILEKRITAEIPATFAKLKEEADVQIFLESQTRKDEMLLKLAEKEVKQLEGSKSAESPIVPVGHRSDGKP